jgi:hypothetical protein
MLNDTIDAPAGHDERDGRIHRFKQPVARDGVEAPPLERGIGAVGPDHDVGGTGAAREILDHLPPDAARMFRIGEAPLQLTRTPPSNAQDGTSAAVNPVDDASYGILIGVHLHARRARRVDPRMISDEVPTPAGRAP